MEISRHYKSGGFFSPSRETDDPITDKDFNLFPSYQMKNTRECAVSAPIFSSPFPLMVETSQQFTKLIFSCSCHMARPYSPAAPAVR